MPKRNRHRSGRASKCAPLVRCHVRPESPACPAPRPPHRYAAGPGFAIVARRRPDANATNLHGGITTNGSSAAQSTLVRKMRALSFREPFTGVRLVGGNVRNNPAGRQRKRLEEQIENDARGKRRSEDGAIGRPALFADRLPGRHSICRSRFGCLSGEKPVHPVSPPPPIGGQSGKFASAPPRSRCRGRPRTRVRDSARTRSRARLLSSSRSSQPPRRPQSSEVPRHGALGCSSEVSALTRPASGSSHLSCCPTFARFLPSLAPELLDVPSHSARESTVPASPGAAAAPPVRPPRHQSSLRLPVHPVKRCPARSVTEQPTRNAS